MRNSKGKGQRQGKSGHRLGKDEVIGTVAAQ